MHDLWASLNQRQRSYLQALYKCDQASEYDRKERGCAVVEAAHPPAFGVGSSMAPPSRQANSTACCAKPSWSTKAPARPGKHWKLAALCSVAAFPTTSACPCSKSKSPLQAANSCALPPVNSAPKLPPKGQLRPRQWAALARLYSAGPAGERSDTMLAIFDWTRTLLRLRDYRPQGLMEEFQQGSEYRIRISAFGRDYYQRQ